MRRFVIRKTGVGTVADGVVLPNERVVLYWHQKKVTELFNLLSEYKLEKRSELVWIDE